MVIFNSYVKLPEGNIDNLFFFGCRWMLPFEFCMFQTVSAQSVSDKRLAKTDTLLRRAYDLLMMIGTVTHPKICLISGMCMDLWIINIYKRYHLVN